jgi:hypothetical protein
MRLKIQVTLWNKIFATVKLIKILILSTQSISIAMLI